MARVIAGLSRRSFEPRSAVTCGVKDFRLVLEQSKRNVRMGHLAIILFIDEVHRLNKAQQDVLLPYLEDGSIRFIGATTENPSFEINAAICSRSLILRFDPLSKEALIKILNAASGKVPKMESEVIEKIASVSVGDARRALMIFEQLTLGAKSQDKITLQDFEAVKHSQSLYYDKHGDKHYDTISAFIKSVRGSDPDAALYYLARMLEGGEDPLFIARRLVILASEDIGNANPFALTTATSGFAATHAIGMPEARIILAQVTTYLACSEKSNRSYVGIDKAIETVKKTGALDVPMVLKNPVTHQMKEWGYGEGYQYAHKGKKGWLPMQFLPDSIKDHRFYEPSENGIEKKLGEFLKRRGK